MTVLFAGGDQRTLAAIEYMKKAGYSVKTYAVTDRYPFDGSRISALVLPFPCLKQGKLNAPMISTPPTLAEMIRETGIDCNIPVIGGPLKENPFPNYTDLSLREDLKLRNAVTTAEGALGLLIAHTDKAVFGMNCMVVGYGAIGKRLSYLLHSMSAKVTVAARKHKDRTDALCHGYDATDTADFSLEGMDALFNTVPFPIFTEEILRTAETDLKFFELASAPWGCDPETAKKCGISVIYGPALPGKVAPVTAGEDLAKTVIHILST